MSPADVGHRVVVRRRLGVEHGRTVYGDVLGVLESWAGGRLALRRRDGELVEVAEDDVVAGKPVPAAPARRPRRGPANAQPAEPAEPAEDAPESGAALALVAARGWPATVTERLGGWLLQEAGGFTGRANSVVPAGDPGCPLDDALRRVAGFYAAAGLPPRIQVVVGTPLEGELLARGWQPRASGKRGFDTTDVRVAPLADVLSRTGAPAVEVTLGGEPDQAWLDLYGRSGPAARKVLGGGHHVALARLTASMAGETNDPGETGQDLVGIGRGVVTGRWLGVSAVEVVPAYRRRGLARAVMAALGTWGRDLGADWAYLQVSADNTDALRLYDRLGFRLDHQYRYYGPAE
nr:GNAT family N-acetyltransferase [Actinopolymorpha rutila]